MNYEKAIKNIRHSLKGYIEFNNIKSLVIGISGGMDSCLCAALAKPVCDELGIPLIGRSLPIRSNQESELYRAILIGSTMCTNFKEDRILEVYYDRMSSELNPDPIIGYNSGDNIKFWKIRNGNMKARLRMIYLYNIASENNGMVLSTDNYTEYMLGFSTIMGDWGDFGMIQYLWKTEVYNMAQWITTNECKNQKDKDIILLTINSLATDGLGVNDNGDLGQIYPDWKGTSRDGYKEVDRILQIWVERNKLENTQRQTIEEELKNNPIIKRHEATHFKRNWPITVKRDGILDNNI